jgi:hypothetical protein
MKYSSSLLIERIHNSKNLINLKLHIKKNLFNLNGKSISQIHRKITNNKNVINGTTNRYFWKNNVRGGYYIVNRNENEIILEYNILTITELSEKKLIELKARIKKVIWCEITIDNSTEIKKGNPINRKKDTFNFIGDFFLENRIIQTSIQNEALKENRLNLA